MQLGFRRKERKIGVVIVSGACCIPGMAPLDEEARRVVEQAVSETGAAVEMKVVPASNAMFGAVPVKVMTKIMSEMNQTGRVPLPAVLINGEAVSYGVPSIEQIKSALIQSANETTTKEEQSDE